jgi:hypothetical protein
LKGTAGIPMTNGIILRRPGIDRQPQPGSMHHRHAIMFKMEVPMQPSPMGGVLLHQEHPGSTGFRYDASGSAVTEKSRFFRYVSSPMMVIFVIQPERDQATSAPG